MTACPSVCLLAVHHHCELLSVFILTHSLTHRVASVRVLLHKQVVAAGRVLQDDGDAFVVQRGDGVHDSRHGVLVAGVKHVVRVLHGVLIKRRQRPHRTTSRGSINSRKTPDAGAGA